ncbi:response regulator transcription factor [Azospirillum rugosum]|uniref:DNA-binding NarL/FixJ family response regulator n=1 Tax=Azospirillum rugosum TaxID=416170 RepID=A0ABS4SHM6_9PROT|nr:response regulator transcription factor [Azospirillum rugosum]MBP2291427.1 DNA-binding NarL/FixJ family response regulator [Azospirillum rugosum]MDQ0525215.1 DNA-binding NarL/FixJ family response regulator [Azospirillum rugosum]
MVENQPSQAKLTILFADENSLTRDCFALSIGALDSGITVHAVPSLDDARQLARQFSRIDAILCNFGSGRDVRPIMPQAIQEAVAAFQDIPLIVISDSDDIVTILECLRTGVRGYIVSSLGLGVALEAIRLVVAGGTFIPASSLNKLAPMPMQTVKGPDGHADMDNIGGLTPREMAVLNCLREGKSNKIIAYKLGMCENTAKAHVRNVLKKLGATNRTEAAYLAHTRFSSPTNIANG